MDQEKVLRAAKIEAEARQLEDNLSIIDNQLNEIESLKTILDSLIKDQTYEVLSSLGSRVYIKTKIEDRNNIFVDVGAGVIVKKSPKDTLNIAIGQISRLQNAKLQILSKLEEYHLELQEFIDNIKRQSSKTI